MLQNNFYFSSPFFEYGARKDCGNICEEDSHRRWKSAQASDEGNLLLLYWRHNNLILMRWKSVTDISNSTRSLTFSSLSPRSPEFPFLLLSEWEDEAHIKNSFWVIKTRCADLEVKSTEPRWERWKDPSFLSAHRASLQKFNYVSDGVLTATNVTNLLYSSQMLEQKRFPTRYESLLSRALSPHLWCVEQLMWKFMRSVYRISTLNFWVSEREQRSSYWR